MKILLVTDSYPPEIRSASHLMLELAQELTTRGHEVTVITTWPEYNLDQREQQKHFNELETEGSTKVIRVKTLPHHNVNYVVRALSQLLMPVQFLLKLHRYKIKTDTVVVYSPPLPLAFVGSWLRRKGVRNLLNVQDLFPQNAIDLGILRSKMQIRFFRALERFAYRPADIVTVHSEGHQTSVDYRKQWGITQKYVAVFAGVMGPSQYLELILGVAERLQEQADLLFLLVGDGKEKERLQQIARDKNLKNVRFEGFISRDTYPDLLNACNIGLVCLSPQNQTPVVPGKILGHMAAGLPVVAFLHTASDGHALITAAHCGVSANSGDLSACVNAMKSMIEDTLACNNMGQAGKRYAIEYFSKQACVSQLIDLLKN